MRLAVAALVLSLLAPAVCAAEDASVGAPAPAFSLRTLNPEAAGAGWVSLEKLVGPRSEDAEARVVLLSFFASWCEPCRRELPFLVQLDRTYRARGLRVVSVDIDADEAGIQAARRLVSEAGLAHPCGSDRFNILARRYLGEKAPLPSAFLVRRNGTIARVDRGYTEDAAAFLAAAVRAELGLPAEAKPARKSGERKAPARH